MEIGLYGVCTDETLRPDEMARLIGAVLPRRDRSAILRPGLGGFGYG